MTKLLVTGSGDQLATGAGVPLTTDASTVKATVAAMVLAVGLSASPSGLATAAVEPMPVTVSLSARIGTKGGVEPMPIAFAMAARMSAVASLSAEPAPVTLDLSARPSGSASATTAPMPVAFDLTARPTAANVASLRAAPMAVAFNLTAHPTRAAILRAAPMSVAVDMAPAKVSVNNGPKFRQFWLDAYAGRQALLNAIDALFCTIAEMELRQVDGGPNLATGGVASAASSFAGFGPGSAFDGDTSTAWATADGGKPSWLAYQLPAASEVRSVSFVAGDTAARAARAPKEFQIQWSDDGVTWTTALYVDRSTGWTPLERRSFTF